MSPTAILWVLLAISFLLNGALFKAYVGAKEDLASEKQAFSSFKAGVQVAGEKAQKAAADKEKADKLAKEKADAENASTVAGLNADLARLRRTRSSPGGSVVPPAPPATARPELAAFDRAELDRAIRGFEEGVEGLVGEGAKAAVDLNSARRWAASP